MPGIRSRCSLLLSDDDTTSFECKIYARCILSPVSKPPANLISGGELRLKDYAICKGPIVSKWPSQT